MESSIAEFVERQLACELLPTESRQDQALKLVKCFGHLKRVGSERVLRTNKQKKSRVCGFQQVSHAVVCIFQAHQSKAVVCMFQAQSCSELKLHMLRHVTHRVCGFQQVGHAVVCMFQAHQGYAVVACPRHRVAQSSCCKCPDSESLQTVHLPLADQICEFATCCIGL